MDCRRANRRFRAPPGVSLLSSEGFGRIEVDLATMTAFCDEHPGTTGIGMGTSDVDNCFHRMKIGAELGCPAGVLMGTFQMESSNAGHDQKIHVFGVVQPTQQ